MVRYRAYVQNIDPLPTSLTKSLKRVSKLCLCILEEDIYIVLMP